MMRTGNFGHIVHFTRHARLSLSLGDYLNDARRLQAGGRPVVFLFRTHIPDRPKAFRINEANVWYLSGTADEVRRFHAGDAASRPLRPGDHR